MSILEQLGARLRSTADTLPLEALTVAAQRLRLATELLIWVRQESANPIGVPGLTSATEHLEQATYALRVAQDTIGDYLAAVGLGYQSAPPPDRTWRDALADASQPHRRPPPEAAEPSPLAHWWKGRVNYLAEHPDTGDPGVRSGTGSGDPGPAGSGSGGASRPSGPEAARKAAQDSAELLRKAARQIQADDRERLRAELAGVEAPVGLGLAAVTPPVLRHLATELLGHEPGADDLKRLDEETRQRVRQLMPRMPEHVVQTQLARVCRVPPPKRSDQPADRSGKPDQSGGSGRGDAEREPEHPTDAAVAGAVLTGILLHRLRRDPETLRPDDRDGAQDDQRSRRRAGEGGRGPAGTDRPGSPDRPGSTGRPGTGSPGRTGSTSGQGAGGNPGGRGGDNPWSGGPRGSHG